MRSKQEIFDIVANHLLEQKAKANTSEGTCMYHVPETGHMCAVGVLLKDCDEEIRNYEGGLGDLLSFCYDFPPELREYEGMLEELQRLHDSMPIYGWNHGLKLIAKLYNLNHTPSSKYMNWEIDMGIDIVTGLVVEKEQENVE